MLDRPRIGSPFGLRLAGLVVEFRMMAIGVVEDDLVWPAGGSNCPLCGNRTPLGGWDDPDLSHGLPPELKRASALVTGRPGALLGVARRHRILSGFEPSGRHYRLAESAGGSPPS